jgi:hypothetical protein
MMARALVFPLILAACVQAGPSVADMADATPIDVDGTTVTATQKSDWPQMIYTVDAAGQSQIAQSGSASTVIIAGANDFDMAVNALGQFCGQTIDPMGFDTQFVYKEPSSGDYWFDGFCG